MRHLFHQSSRDGHEPGRGEDGRHGVFGPHERGRGRFGHDDEGSRGRRRMFDASALRLVFLHLMEGRPRHGYDLIREIETRTGGGYAPSPGVVYPTLTLLEELDQIVAVESEGSKRAFTVTPAGIAHLADNKEALEAALRRLDALGAEGGRLQAGPIFRAMHNLRTALRLRLASAHDKQAAFEVADILDEAARKIERLP